MSEARPLPPRPRAVVTGAGSGLGRALALQLAPRKARLLLADIDLKAAKETVRLAEALGAEAVAVKCDVAKAAQVAKLARVAAEKWRGADLLVNNAGVAAGGPVGEMPLADWHWIAGINLWGPVYGCHAFVPGMKKRRRGWILNVASTAGLASLPEMAAYNVTKAGVIALTETLYSELAPYGIQATALCPTYFKTNLMARFRSPNRRQRDISNAFFARASFTADDVARAGLAGLEAGRLLVIPQPDGQAVFRAKRGDYDGYFDHLRAQVGDGTFDRLAAEGRKPKRKSP